MTKTILLGIACVMGCAMIGPVAAAPLDRTLREMVRPKEHVTEELPRAWSITGDNEREYEGGTDLTIQRGGKPSGYIRSIGFNMQGYGTLVSIQDATPYRGKTVRVSAEIKSEGIQRWAGLWVAVDSAAKPFNPNQDESDRFKLQHQQSLVGTKDWLSASLEIDVPQDTSRLLLGLAMAGRGKAYINRVTVDVVTPKASTPPSLDF